MKPIVRLRKWLTTSIRAARKPVSYTVVCSCGSTCQGLRSDRAQAIPCPACGQAVFVLPISPLPPVHSPELARAQPVAASAGTLRNRAWVGPLLGGLAALLVMAILGVYLLNAFLPARRPAPPSTEASAIDEHLRAGRRSLQNGDYPHAHKHFLEAREILRNQPERAPAELRRQLTQLQEQAALLVDWPNDTLEQILGGADRLKEEDWRLMLGRYRGKAVAFDVEIQRGPAGLQIRWKRAAAIPEIRLELDNLKLLKKLPLDDTQRVVFAGRLADIRRPGPESFSVLLEPDSGVLLTDVNFALLGLQVPQEVIEQQQRWLAERF